MAGIAEFTHTFEKPPRQELAVWTHHYGEISHS